MQAAPLLVLHCGEALLLASVERLLESHAPGVQADRLSLPGGCWWVAEAAGLTEGRVKRALLRGRMPVREAVEALLDGGNVREVMLVAHEGCAWYRRSAPGASAGDLVKQQGRDMLRARAEIERWAPRGTAVGGWMLVAAEGEAGMRKLF